MYSFQYFLPAISTSILTARINTKAPTVPFRNRKTFPYSSVQCGIGTHELETENSETRVIINPIPGINRTRVTRKASSSDLIFLILVLMNSKRTTNSNPTINTPE